MKMDDLCHNIGFETDVPIGFDLIPVRNLIIRKIEDDVASAVNELRRELDATPPRWTKIRRELEFEIFTVERVKNRILT